jgi:hypothetical protein
MLVRAWVRASSWARSWTCHGGEAGQATAEYALVILGAVALATLLLNWARGSHAISRLFDSIIEQVMPG